MAVAIKSLADGTVPTPNVDNLYPASGTVPTGKTVLVKNMRFVNSGTAEATLNIYFTGSGQRRILPMDVKLPVGFELIETQEISLEEGDKLEAKSSVGNVDYVISGVERDVV